MEWYELIAAVCAGLSVTIPLVHKLIVYVQKAAKEKNWSEIVDLAIEYMKTAENMFDSGSDRKEWVIAMVQTSAVSIEYDLDNTALAKISDLIDTVCDASKVINTEVAENEHGTAV